jgi:hypothetical protein
MHPDVGAYIDCAGPRADIASQSLSEMALVEAIEEEIPIKPTRGVYVHSLIEDSANGPFH